MYTKKIAMILNKFLYKPYKNNKIKKQLMYEYNNYNFYRSIRLFKKNLLKHKL